MAFINADIKVVEKTFMQDMDYKPQDRYDIYLWFVENPDRFVELFTKKLHNYIAYRNLVFKNAKNDIGLIYKVSTIWYLEKGIDEEVGDYDLVDIYLLKRRLDEEKRQAQAIKHKRV